MEFLFEFIPGRLLAFALALGIAVGGWFVWGGGNEERALYDAATGGGGKTVQAKIRYKTERMESSGDEDAPGYTAVSYLEFEFEENGEWQFIEGRVSGDEYRSVKVGDTMKISFHPANLDYIVTPAKSRPSVIWFRIGGAILMFIGGILMLMILGSLLD